MKYIFLFVVAMVTSSNAQVKPISDYVQPMINVSKIEPISFNVSYSPILDKNNTPISSIVELNKFLENTIREIPYSTVNIQGIQVNARELLSLVQTVNLVVFNGVDSRQAGIALISQIIQALNGNALTISSNITTINSIKATTKEISDAVCLFADIQTSLQLTLPEINNIIVAINVSTKSIETNIIPIDSLLAKGQNLNFSGAFLNIKGKSVLLLNDYILTINDMDLIDESLSTVLTMKAPDYTYFGLWRKHINELLKDNKTEEAIHEAKIYTKSWNDYSKKINPRRQRH